jgi:MFS family permease
MALADTLRASAAAPLGQRRAWLVMLAAYLAGVVVALNQFKVPPVMPALLAELSMDTAMGGWLMSSFAVAGILLGLPAALIFSRLGPRRAGLLALGCTVAGSVGGALAPSAAALLGARVIEGIGLGLITVIAPAVISLWFAPEDRGRPMGLWATWVPVGSFTIYNLAGPMMAASGWRSLWWLGAALGVLAFALYAALVDAPPKAAGDPGPAPAAESLWSVLRSPAPALLALTFATFTFAGTAYSTWAPTYLTETLRLTPQAASFTASLSMLAVIPSAQVAGWVLDHTRRRTLVLTLAVLGWGLLWMLSFRLATPAMAALFMLASGFVGGFIPTAIFTLAPETLPRPELAGWVIGLVSVGQNLGMFLGPPTMGARIAGGTWSAGLPVLLVAAAVGTATAYALQRVATRAAAATDPFGGRLRDTNPPAGAGDEGQIAVGGR